MISHTSTIRVRYAETDQMGFVYYGIYATYFEVARVELMRQFGISYKELEREGILMPVTHFDIRYTKPARYDDMLTVSTHLTSLTAARVTFEYKVHEAANKICEATTVLAFLDASTLRPKRCPEHIAKLFLTDFNSRK
jgi:acyl-CoA thioester hydrolase